jgi:hypothetical protein
MSRRQSAQLGDSSEGSRWRLQSRIRFYLHLNTATLAEPSD